MADPKPLPAAPVSRVAPLPGALAEVRQAIASRLPGARCTALTGAEAGRDRGVAPLVGCVRHPPRDARIVRDGDPFASFLALRADGIGRGTTGLGGVAAAGPASSAERCGSGLGEVSADGIVGLTRAFFFAGTPSVVASLWDVADGPSARLLRVFYAALDRGATIAEALRTAQLSMLADLRAGRVTVGGATGARLPERPVFWAGFVLVGEP